MFTSAGLSRHWWSIAAIKQTYITRINSTTYHLCSFYQTLQSSNQKHKCNSSLVLVQNWSVNIINLYFFFFGWVGGGRFIVSYYWYSINNGSYYWEHSLIFFCGNSWYFIHCSLVNSKIQKNSIYLHLNMWKKINIFVEIVIFFIILWWIEIFKRSAFVCNRNML